MLVRGIGEVAIRNTVTGLDPVTPGWLAHLQHVIGSVLTGDVCLRCL